MGTAGTAKVTREAGCGVREGQRAAGRLGDLAGDGEPEAGAGAGEVEAGAAPGELVEAALGDAGAVVARC